MNRDLIQLKDYSIKPHNLDESATPLYVEPKKVEHPTHLTKFEKVRTIGAVTSVVLQIVAVILQILIAIHVGLL